MSYARFRTYPRVYKKNNAEDKEEILNVSLAAAVGVLVLSFAKGMFWGYMLRKRVE